MAPTVLCRTPDDGGVVDRTGILAASEPGARAVPTEELGVVGGPRKRVNRSGVASVATAVLMFVLALSFVVDVGAPAEPGGGVGDRLVVAERGSQGDRAERAPQAPTVAPDARPDRRPVERPAAVVQEPAPESVPEPESEPTVVAEPAPDQPAMTEPAEPPAEPVTPQARSSAASTPDAPVSGVVGTESAGQAEPELRSDLPPRSPVRTTATAPMRFDRFSDLIEPMVKLYRRSVRDVDAWRDRLAEHGRGW